MYKVLWDKVGVSTRISGAMWNLTLILKTTVSPGTDYMFLLYLKSLKTPIDVSSLLRNRK